MPLNIIQRQLGHANLGTTSIYLQGIDPEEIITAVRTRRMPNDVCQRRTQALSRTHRGERDADRLLPLVPGEGFGMWVGCIPCAALFGWLGYCISLRFVSATGWRGRGGWNGGLARQRQPV